MTVVSLKGGPVEIPSEGSREQRFASYFRGLADGILAGTIPLEGFVGVFVMPGPIEGSQQISLSSLDLSQIQTLGVLSCATRIGGGG